MQTAWIAVAGAIGAVARYRIGVAVGVQTFPWATLLVNVVGSFALAFLFAGPAATRWSPMVTMAIAVGLLGGFTTFSSFGYETFTLFREGREAAAAAYLSLSMIGGVAATGLGYLTGRSLVA